MKNILRARLAVLLSPCTTARQIRAPPSLHCLATNVTGRYQLTNNTSCAAPKSPRRVLDLSNSNNVGHGSAVLSSTLPSCQCSACYAFHSRLRVRHGQTDRFKYASVTERRMDGPHCHYILCYPVAYYAV